MFWHRLVVVLSIGQQERINGSYLKLLIGRGAKISLMDEVRRRQKTPTGRSLMFDFVILGW